MAASRARSATPPRPELDRPAGATPAIEPAHGVLEGHVGEPRHGEAGDGRHPGLDGPPPPPAVEEQEDLRGAHPHEGVDERFGPHRRGEPEEGAGGEGPARDALPLQDARQEGDGPEDERGTRRVLPEVEGVHDDGRRQADGPERDPSGPIRGRRPAGDRTRCERGTDPAQHREQQGHPVAAQRVQRTRRLQHREGRDLDPVAGHLAHVTDRVQVPGRVRSSRPVAEVRVVRARVVHHLERGDLRAGVGPEVAARVVGEGEGRIDREEQGARHQRPGQEPGQLLCTAVRHHGSVPGLAHAGPPAGPRTTIDQLPS